MQYHPAVVVIPPLQISADTADRNRTLGIVGMLCIGKKKRQYRTASPTLGGSGDGSGISGADLMCNRAAAHNAGRCPACTGCNTTPH